MGTPTCCADTPPLLPRTDEVYKPSEHDGLREDGQPDKRKSSEHGFGADRERASEEGKKGGQSS